MGTAAMLPRADGGVVSPSLVVYGTANVRVVDLSIVPIHVSAHVGLILASRLKLHDLTTHTAQTQSVACESIILVLLVFA